VHNIFNITVLFILSIWCERFGAIDKVTNHYRHDSDHDHHNYYCYPPHYYTHHHHLYIDCRHFNILFMKVIQFN